eukprot:2064771-Rhodomonas_salina.1
MKGSRTAHTMGNGLTTFATDVRCSSPTLLCKSRLHRYDGASAVVQLLDPVDAAADRGEHAEAAVGAADAVAVEVPVVVHTTTTTVDKTASAISATVPLRRRSPT